eukprot:gene17794-biopygen20225
MAVLEPVHGMIPEEVPRGRCRIFSPSLNYDKADSNPHDGAVNSLRGLDDCLSDLKKGGRPVRGVYHWHGWDNGDSY